MKNRFKEVRKHFGLSQAQYAGRINRSPGFISNVETGRSDVSGETLAMVCSVFSVNEEWLRTGTGDMLSDKKPAVDLAGIGKRVKEVRRLADLSQKQFGEKIGYSKMHIYYVENGKSIPSDSFLSNVARVFRIDRAWLLTGEGACGFGAYEKPVADPVDEDLINWLRQNPDVAMELRKRGGLD